MGNEENYLSIIEFYKLFIEITNTDMGNNFFTKFFTKKKIIKQLKRLIRIIDKIPDTRALNITDLKEYLFFMNSSNLPDGDYGIISKSIDQSDMISNKKSIYAEYTLNSDINSESSIYEYFKANSIKIYGSIIIEEDIELKICIDNLSTRLNGHSNLHKLLIEAKDSYDKKDNAIKEAVEILNKRLVADIHNFLLDIIVSNVDDSIRKEIEKYAKDFYRSLGR